MTITPIDINSKYCYFSVKYQYMYNAFEHMQMGQHISECNYYKLLTLVGLQESACERQAKSRELHYSIQCRIK